MSIFGKIKDAIFGKKASAQDLPQGGALPSTSTAPGTIASGFGAGTAAPTQQPVDVEAQLDAMPGADKLNWRTSIVDLMKLLDIDSSYENRKELAHELGRQDYSGSADDNVWLHRRTMQALSENGGKVPANFLD